MILRNARCISFLTEGYEQEYADLLIKDGCIMKIEKPGYIPSEETEEELDLSGATLMPGLFDLHMHTYFYTDNFYEVASYNANQNLLHAIRYANDMLSMGYTTLRDCGNTNYLGVDLRNAIEEGALPGPTIITSGKCLSPYAKGNETFPGLYYEVNNPAEIVAAVRDENARGVDFIKYMATGSVANRNGEPGALITTKEELEAINKAAEQNGLYTAVHCHGTEGIRLCIEAGIRTIEHASFFTDDCIEKIHRMGDRTALIPTLFPVVDAHNAFALSGTKNYMTGQIEQCYQAAQGLVTACRNGILLGWGTDVCRTSFLAKPGFEFLARKQVGFTNQEILLQATIHSAKIAGLQESLGTIKVGKQADLVVVNGKPEDDITVMTRQPAYVFKKGLLQKTI